MATAFNSVFSASTIDAIRKDKKSYAKFTFANNFVRVHNYSLAFEYYHRAMMYTYGDNYVDVCSQKTSKELKAALHAFFFDGINGDNVDSYGKEAEKIIWYFFLRTSEICDCSIRDVNNVLTFSLYNASGNQVALFHGVNANVVWGQEHFICQL